MANSVSAKATTNITTIVSTIEHLLDLLKVVGWFNIPNSTKQRNRPKAIGRNTMKQDNVQGIEP
jgi:hypothetical protein